MTAPIVPAEVDLRGMPFMPLDTVRLADSDLFALSTGDEFKAAVMLWCKSWHQVPAASLPDDDRILAHLSSSYARWPAVRELALRGWVKCDDGRLYHPVIAEKALEAWVHRKAQRAKAARRWGHGPELPGITPGIPAGDAAASESESPGNAAARQSASRGSPAADAAAMQGTGTVKGQGQGQKNKGSLSAGLNGHAQPGRGTRMTDEWRIPDEWREWAMRFASWDSQRVVRESARFRDHYLAVPGDKGVMRSWSAAWRNWMRIAVEKEQRRGT
jgi:hypothetical protein